jgi:hypothetical protein
MNQRREYFSRNISKIRANSQLDQVTKDKIKIPLYEKAIQQSHHFRVSSILAVNNQRLRLSSASVIDDHKVDSVNKFSSEIDINKKTQ